MLHYVHEAVDNRTKKKWQDINPMISFVTLKCQKQLKKIKHFFKKPLLS